MPITSSGVTEPNVQNQHDTARSKRNHSWSETEITTLWTLISQYGNQWKRVSATFPERSVVQIKRKGLTLLKSNGWKTKTKVAKSEAITIAAKILSGNNDSIMLTRDKNVKPTQKHRAQATKTNRNIAKKKPNKKLKKQTKTIQNKKKRRSK